MVKDKGKQKEKDKGKEKEKPPELDLLTYNGESGGEARCGERDPGKLTFEA